MPHGVPVSENPLDLSRSCVCGFPGERKRVFGVCGSLSAECLMVFPLLFVPFADQNRSTVGIWPGRDNAAVKECDGGDVSERLSATLLDPLTDPDGRFVVVVADRDQLLVKGDAGQSEPGRTIRVEVVPIVINVRMMWRPFPGQ